MSAGTAVVIAFIVGTIVWIAAGVIRNPPGGVDDNDGTADEV